MLVIDALPMTVNGKLDTRALPAPDSRGVDHYRAPATAVEEILAGIYGQVLSAERVGADDSFFDLGGDSLAAMRVLEAEAGADLKRDAKFVAGHSLGEYSALAAAGTFTIPDTARLLRVRGRAMQQAVPVGTGAMAAILGLDAQAVRAGCSAAAEATGETVAAANYNDPKQTVIAGTKLVS